jgi:hypothetical protein
LLSIAITDFHHVDHAACSQSVNLS